MRNPTFVDAQIVAGAFSGAIIRIAVRCDFEPLACERRSPRWLPPGRTPSRRLRPVAKSVAAPLISIKFRRVLAASRSRVRRGLRLCCDVGRGCRLGSAAKASYFEVRCLSLAGGEPLGRPNRSCRRGGRSRPTARRRPSQHSPTSNLSMWSNLSRATESPSRTPGSSSSISIVCASRAVAPL